MKKPLSQFPRRTGLLPVLLLLSLLTGCANQPSFHFDQLPSLPNPLGFAGHFAGVSDDSLLVAGGSNFPDKLPWDGGKKVWYDQIFLLTSPHSSWQLIGHFPRPAAYGVSVTTPNGLLCLGGGDAHEHFRQVILLRYTAGQLSFSSLPDLPSPCAFMAGALLDHTIYIAGGIDSPASTHCLQTFWSLDLQNLSAGWQILPACPGPPRILAVAASADNSFYLFSGTTLSPDKDAKPVRHYLRDAWRYSPSTGWQRLPDLPRPAVAAPSPAPLINHHLLLISGDDGANTHFKPETAHPGFPKTILSYDLATHTWSTLPVPISRAALPAVPWRDSFILPNGEVRPGYRTPEVWSLSR